LREDNLFRFSSGFFPGAEAGCLGDLSVFFSYGNSEEKNDDAQNQDAEENDGQLGARNLQLSEFSVLHHAFSGFVFS
jgi:hypothetical protein